MPLNIDFQQVLLHMLNFAVLFAAMYFLLYNPVKKFMDGRDERIKEYEQKTGAALREAEKLREEYEEKLAEANAEADGIIAEARKTAAENTEKTKAEAKAEAETIISNAKKAAEKEKSAAVKSASREIRELAETAAGKLVIEGKDAYDSFFAAFEGESD